MQRSPIFQHILTCETCDGGGACLFGTALWRTDAHARNMGELSGAIALLQEKFSHFLRQNLRP